MSHLSCPAHAKLDESCNAVHNRTSVYAATCHGVACAAIVPYPSKAMSCETILHTRFKVWLVMQVTELTGLEHSELRAKVGNNIVYNTLVSVSGVNADLAPQWRHAGVLAPTSANLMSTASGPNMLSAAAHASNARRHVTWNLL